MAWEVASTRSSRLDQFNLYTYVGNDPLNGTDPSGLCAVDEEGNISQCEITYDKKMTEAQRRAAEEMVKQIAVVGKKFKKRVAMS